MTRKKTFDDYLSDANNRLKLAKVRVNIEQRRNRLCLRANLPPKPDRPDLGYHSQRVSLGVSANREGLQLAEAKAKEIGVKLDQRSFDWNLYLPVEDSLSPLVRELIKHLEVDYGNKGGNPDTFRVEYLSQFRKIPDWDRPVNLAELKGLIYQENHNSRARKRAAIAFSKLADLAGLSHDLGSLKGSYSSFKPVNPRDIPSDEDIKAWRDKIDCPFWKNAYSLQAIYGLRNYEVWTVDLSDFPVLFCHKGKTDQERFIYPLYPEWATNWLDLSIGFPIATGKNTSLGHRVSDFFRTHNFPFNPYDLRHAWARRALEFGWGTSDAATQMGHSEAVHTKIYQHWINRDSYEKIFGRLMSDPNRPKPP